MNTIVTKPQPLIDFCLTLSGLAANIVFLKSCMANPHHALNTGSSTYELNIASFSRACVTIYGKKHVHSVEFNSFFNSEILNMLSDSFNKLSNYLDNKQANDNIFDLEYQDYNLAFDILEGKEQMYN